MQLKQRTAVISALDPVLELLHNAIQLSEDAISTHRPSWKTGLCHR